MVGVHAWVMRSSHGKVMMIRGQNCRELVVEPVPDWFRRQSSTVMTTTEFRKSKLHHFAESTHSTAIGQLHLACCNRGGRNRAAYLGPWDGGAVVLLLCCSCSTGVLCRACTMTMLGGR